MLLRLENANLETFKNEKKSIKVVLNSLNELNTKLMGKGTFVHEISEQSEQIEINQLY